MGSDDLYKNEDPIFYCPDCDKYYVIHQSGMSPQEKTDFFDYVYDYFGFEGTVLEFIQAFFEGDVPDAEETSDEETVDVKVKEEKKDGIAEEVIESDGKVSIQIPTSKVLKGIVNKIKSKVCSK
jgi:methionyl-tRNA synthetase